MMEKKIKVYDLCTVSKQLLEIAQIHSILKAVMKKFEESAKRLDKLYYCKRWFNIIFIF